jgi:hypothetical protein
VRVLYFQFAVHSRLGFGFCYFLLEPLSLRAFSFLSGSHYIILKSACRQGRPILDIPTYIKVARLANERAPGAWRDAEVDFLIASLEHRLPAGLNAIGVRLLPT